MDVRALNERRTPRRSSSKHCGQFPTVLKKRYPGTAGCRQPSGVSPGKSFGIAKENVVLQVGEGSGPLKGGTANFTTSKLRTGTYESKATYIGDTSLQNSSATVAQVVEKP